MILQRLKMETRAQHAALESQLPLLDASMSLEAYRQCLRRFYGYYLPLESLLMAQPVWDELGFDYTERCKAHGLQRDLLALGDSPAQLMQIPRCHDIPKLHTLAQVLGCLYVIEGATLGGQIITKHLQANLRLTPNHGATFFSGYGVRTGALWKAFGTMLITRAEQAASASASEIVDSANQTFQTLEQWLFHKVACV